MLDKARVPWDPNSRPADSRRGILPSHGCGYHGLSCRFPFACELQPCWEPLCRRSRSRSRTSSSFLLTMLATRQSAATAEPPTPSPVSIDWRAGGARFRHCYSMPVCHPTRVTLMTGKYPFRVGNAPWGTFPKALEGETIANRLKKLGYATAVAGKWQLTLLRDDLDHPKRLGFDRWSLFGWHEGPRYYRPLDV